MSDQNADVNVIRVDTGAMREAAIAINSNLDAIDTAVQELQKMLNAFNPNTADEATWVGSAATVYAKTYEKLLGLLEEAERGEFTPLTEKEMLIELKVFVEHRTCDCYFNTHHTSGIHLSGPDFLKRKDKIIKALEQEIGHGDMDALLAIRRNKRTL